MILAITLRRTLKSSNATNWPGLIILDRQLACPAAVWAQEAYEATWKLNPINLVRKLTSRKTRREMELMSHMIEVIVLVELYGMNQELSLATEAFALHNGYDGLFSEYSLEEVAKGMLKYQKEAQRWYDKHAERISKYK